MSGKRTAELEGFELDYWVAKALNLHDIRIGDNGTIQKIHRIFYTNMPKNGADMPSEIEFRPSFYWEQGGPIIENNKISISFRGYCKKPWYASFAGDDWITGETFLIAAMRCFVNIKIGEYVDDSTSLT